MLQHMHSAGTFGTCGCVAGDVFARIPVEMCYKLDAAVEFLPVSTRPQPKPC